MSELPSQLPPSEVGPAEEFIVNWLAESYPSLDLREGLVTRDLIVLPGAYLRVLDRRDLDRVNRANSKAELEADPSAAEPGDLDRLYSNYLITRTAGVPSAGSVTIVLSAEISTLIRASSVFTINGKAFSPVADYVAVTSDTQLAAGILGSNQRRLTKRIDGNYEFTIQVQSALSEVVSVRRNTPVTISPSPSGLVTAYATADFAAGKATETDAELIARLKEGISPKIMAGPVQIEAAIRAAFPETYDVYVVRAREPEMLRDRTSVMPFGVGGKTDVWLRSRAVPEQIVVTAVKGVLLSSTLIRLVLNRDAAPGFYTVDAVYRTGSATALTISKEQRGLDTTSVPEGWPIPAIKNQLTGGYSRFQNATLDVQDPSGLNEDGYDILCSYMPGLSEVQNLCSIGANSGPAFDILVRSCIPAICSAELIVRDPGTITTADKDNVKQAVAEAVNRLPMGTDRLALSVVLDAAQGVLGVRGAFVMSPTRLVVKIRAPEGTILSIDGTSDAVLPYRPDISTTPNTIGLILDPNNVSVTYKTKGTQ